MDKATVVWIIISGLLNGGVYALAAMGLSVQYGVARVLNLSHGEFIMFAAWLTFSFFTGLAGFEINPLVSVAIIAPLFLGIGFLIHRTVFTTLRKRAPSAAAFEGNSLLVAFGLLYVVQNIALLIWKGVPRAYFWLTSGVDILGVRFALNNVIALAVAVALGVAFYVFVNRSRLGKAIRAAAEDPATAGLMGININRVLPLCFGLGALLAGIAGVLLSMCYSISTSMGLGYTVIALIVVALGGLGSIPGSFIGGFILGIIGSIVIHFQPALTMIAFYAILMILLVARPKGILGKM
jgi:branched-chain amino acid transport system permease protein